VTKTVEELKLDFAAMMERHQREAERLLEQIGEADRRLNLPEPTGHMFSVGVQFTPQGKIYQYLVLREGSTYYTTAVGASARFEGWEAFVRWLDKAYWHGTLYTLATVGQALPPKGRKS
jgi:rubrerythrin